jgi:hypothetical protein
MTAIAQKVDPLDLLYEKSCTLATRVADSELGFLDAVDMAYSAAQWAGLCETAGDDAVQIVLATAFMGVPKGAT